LNSISKAKLDGASILIVEDEPDIARLLSYSLSKEGATIETVADGKQGLETALNGSFDLILLDLMLPSMDGMEVCKRVKNEMEKAPKIIMVTARTQDDDQVAGLELGADDYITKPFSPKVLIARSQKLLNPESNVSVPNANKINVGAITIDLLRHEVSIADQIIDLSATEFDILELLARNPGWVYSRTKIINSIKGEDYPVTDRSVDVQILGLRKKLGKYSNYVQTVRGVGYRLQA
jgi:DNA-binding response OmpR family regulator